MKTIALALIAALASTSFAAQGRDDPAVERFGRNAGAYPAKPAVTLNTAVRSSVSVSAVLGRAGGPQLLAERKTPGASWLAQRNVSSVLGRS